MARRVNENGEPIVDTAIEEGERVMKITEQKTYYDYEGGSHIWQNVECSSTRQSEAWLSLTPSREIRYIKPEMLATAFRIKKAIFNPPATIVLWEDGTKTVVKCQMCGACIGRIEAPMEFHPCYDPEKGLAMCIAKKALGNKGNYYNAFKKWLKENE